MTTINNHFFSEIPNTQYPCDRGTETKIGWHNYVAGENGVVICTYCGKRATI